jgi:N6-adenosine-specific RNA methylase IME4
MTAAERKQRSRTGQCHLPVGTATIDMTALLESGKQYSVILADPPWSYQTWGERGKDRSAENHYGTMSMEQIRALPVEKLAADDAILLLWATWPTLPEALKVIEAWGFAYCTIGMDWMKENARSAGIFIGMGYYFRSNTEPCLFAKRGNVPRYKGKDAVSSALLAPIGEHSRKPAEAHHRIEKLAAGIPTIKNGPKLELFARRPMLGWDTWGNQVCNPHPGSSR